MYCLHISLTSNSTRPTFILTAHHQMEKEMASKLEKEGTGVEGTMEEEDLPKQVRTPKSFFTYPLGSFRRSR